MWLNIIIGWEEMLGIIFTGGLGPDSQIVKKLLETEAKDALIVAADSGLVAAKKAGIEPDWVIGDFDSLDDLSMLNALPKERVIRLLHEKDCTDTEAAVSLVKEKGCNCFWIIGGGGGRIDHLFGIRSIFEKDFFPSRWITDSADIWCVDKEICLSLEKEAVVSVFPLGSGPWEAKSSGLKWQLEGLPWNRGFFGLSNVAVDGKFSIEVKSGRFMVILPN